MISRDEVLQLAALARLELSEGEVSELQRDISNILDYVGQVSTISVPNKKDEKPEPRNVMREDVAYEHMLISDKEESLRAAFPKREGDFNVVRKILQKDE